MRKLRDGNTSSQNLSLHDHSAPAAGLADPNYHHHQQQQQQSTNGKEWLVILFRRTVSRGWEVYFPNGMDSVSKNNASVASTTNNKKKGGKNFNNSSHQQKLKQPQLDQYIEQQLITVTPKSGCIEMKQLRLRIPLSSSNTSNSSTTGSNGNDNASFAATTSAVLPSVTVTRRMDTILLTTTRGGCIVLKFTSLESCLSFCDELVLLNTTVNAPAYNDDGDDNYENSNNPRKHLLDLASRKSKRYERESTSSTANNITTGKYSSDYKYEEFRSMLIRLLHEEDFMDLVNELDDCLTSNIDGATMLQNAASSLIAKVHSTP